MATPPMTNLRISKLLEVLIMHLYNKMDLEDRTLQCLHMALQPSKPTLNIMYYFVRISSIATMNNVVKSVLPAMLMSNICQSKKEKASSTKKATQ